MSLPDRSKIEYAKKRLRRNYTGPDLTSGQLVSGKYYLIADFVTGDDFSNVGAKLNKRGQVFKATGTAPTTWAGSTLNESKVDDMKADADKTFDAATSTVTLNSSNFEGGQQSGDITFEKVLLGLALEELIEEFDPGWQPPPAVGGGLVMQFSV